jgi:hypothetical protein
LSVVAFPTGMSPEVIAIARLIHGLGRHSATESVLGNVPAGVFQ